MRSTPQVVLTSQDTIVEGNKCVASHGISLTPMDSTINGFLARNNVIEGGDCGLRIKAQTGIRSSVSNASFVFNTLTDIKQYGIDVQFNYPARPEDAVKSSSSIETSGSTMSGISFSDITGNVQAGGYPVAIVCGEGACKDWSWEGVSITGGTKFPCVGAPAGAAC